MRNGSTSPKRRVSFNPQFKLHREADDYWNLRYFHLVQLSSRQAVRQIVQCVRHHCCFTMAVWINQHTHAEHFCLHAKSTCVHIRKWCNETSCMSNVWVKILKKNILYELNMYLGAKQSHVVHNALVGLHWLHVNILNDFVQKINFPWKVSFMNTICIKLREHTYYLLQRIMQFNEFNW